MKTNERRSYKDDCSYSVLCREDKEQLDRIEKNQIRASQTVIPSLDLLQSRLEEGCKIEFQEGMWHLFEESGEVVTSGKSIREMLVNLIFTDC